MNGDNTLLDEESIKQLSRSLDSSNYIPLFISFKKIIEALNANLNYVENKTNKLNKKLNFIIFLFLVILAVLIFKWG